MGTDHISVIVVTLVPLLALTHFGICAFSVYFLYIIDFSLVRYDTCCLFLSPSPWAERRQHGTLVRRCQQYRSRRLLRHIQGEVPWPSKSMKVVTDAARCGIVALLFV